MKLTFCGKSPQQRFFRIGVVGNNLADDLTMIIDKKQGNLNLAEFTPFIKIVNRDFTFVDKTRHFIFDVDTDPEKVRLIYVFPKKVTRQRNVEYVLVLANSGVSAGTYTKVTVNAKGIITSATQLTAADIPALTLSKISDAGTAASKNTGTAAGNVPVLDANAKIAVALIPSLTLSKISDAGTAAGKNVGTAAGNVPVLGSDGKLDESLLPAIAITETFVVDSQAAMLALSAQRGDVAVRTDENKSYILNADDPTVLANWVWLRTPDCKVLSVNSKTGAVVLTTSDIAEGTNLYFTEARATANFNSNFKNKSVTELKDGANVVLSTDTLTINGGKA